MKDSVTITNSQVVNKDDVFSKNYNTERMFWEEHVLVTSGNTRGKMISGMKASWWEQI